MGEVREDVGERTSTVELLGVAGDGSSSFGLLTLGLGDFLSPDIIESRLALAGFLPLVAL